ncbi:hypothetical protein COB72_07385 [bacterium]|nr:MAG: hypothetical protein COB72_07385 [bacterium]
MSTFPTSYSRSPTLLFSQNSLNALGRTNFQLSRLNEQLSTGLDLLRPSDDPIRSATISILDSRLEYNDQLLKNLQFAGNSLATLDNALGDAKSLIDEAYGIALGQISTPSDRESRSGQAIIIDSLINSLYGISNTESIVGYVFGGTNPGSPPVNFINGGYNFSGERGGLLAALGTASDVPITLGADNAIGALSNRIEGSVDLNPDLSDSTRLVDLNGARDLGISQGVFEMSFNSGVSVSVDISAADTIGDVADIIEAAIIQYESDNGVTILGPGGVGTSGGSLDFDIAGGSLEFTDNLGSNVGKDLGIVQDPAVALTTLAGTGIDLNPNLTWTTSISSLSGLGGNALDDIQLQINGQSVTVDLSGATNLGDIRSQIEAAGTGIRVEIGEDGTGINIITESATTINQAMSISEVSGGNDTATLLGIRSFASDTPLSVFNDGRGIEISDDKDFVITLGDGYEIPINLLPADIATVGSLITAINTQANAQLTADGRPTTQFDAQLSATTNGIEFTQSFVISPANSLSISPASNSPAAEQLGLLDTTSTNGGDTLISEDRAKVRVINLFTHLLDLSEALRNDDTLGIQLASQEMKVSLDELIQSRALVGGYAKRIDTEVVRQEDKRIFDLSMRSELRDLDYAAASSRFSQLQLQMQATLSVIGQTQSRTLLDFLG